MRSARSGSSLMREDAAIGARDEAVVDGRRVGQVAALGDLDRVDLADQVGDGDVGRGQLLGVAAVARQPRRSASGRLRLRRAAWAVGLIGASGSSLSSPPATTGMCSSSRPTSSRARRVLAWPRSPRKQMSWPARMAFSICRDDACRRSRRCPGRSAPPTPAGAAGWRAAPSLTERGCVAAARAARRASVPGLPGSWPCPTPVHHAASVLRIPRNLV